MTSMYDTLVDTLVNRFDVDRVEITPGITFEDLEMDSLFLVELLVVLQTELGVMISDDTATPRDTLERAAEAIEEQIAAASSSS